jgi:Winged helix DNA-binding domain
MRSIVTRPMPNGEVSGRLAELMDPPYLRFCRPCNATHVYEMPFRLAALRAGLELEAGTSPPTLRPIAGFRRAAKPSPRYDVVRAYLRLLGPATAKQVADYLDAPVKDVRDRWPEDAEEVLVEGEKRWVLSGDAQMLTSDPVRTTRLLGPYDLFLQARDRQTLLGDPARAKALWPVLGRPGAIVIDNEIAGLWRPRKVGKYLRVSTELWVSSPTRVRTAITEQAERLAAHRGTTLAGVDFNG